METRFRSSIRRLTPCALAAALVFATPVIAFETLRKGYGEEWVDVSPEIAATLPALDFWKTLDPKIPQKYFYYRPSLYLFVLRYPITEVAAGDSGEFRAAVKAFQRDLGSKPTGVLTVAQYITLEDRAAWLRTTWVDPWLGTPTLSTPPSGSVDVSPPTTAFLHQDEGTVDIFGLLASHAVPPGRVLTTVRAECQRHSMRCTAVTVESDFWLQLFTYDSPVVRASFPWATAVTLDIGEWTDDRIVASPEPGSDAKFCLVLFPQSEKAFKGDVVVVDPLAPPATDASQVPAGPGRLCAQDEEVLPLTMPAEVQRRTEQLYGRAARTFVADWRAKDQEYHDALQEAAQKRKALDDAAKTPRP